MPYLSCLECGALSGEPRCEKHRNPHRLKNRDWQAKSKATIAAHPWCAWCDATEDLTTDEIQPGNPDGPLRVLCRRCNGRRAAGRHEAPPKGGWSPDPRPKSNPPLY